MDVSRLIFRKETKDNMKSELNLTQKGRLRWGKIKEADENGSLSKAKNRYEVANFAGFTNETRARGYQWVSNMIKRNHLQEIIAGTNRYGGVEYEYHVLDDPDYSKENARQARWANKNIKEKPTVEPKPVNKINEPVILTKVGDKTSKVTVTYGDVVVGVESVELAMIPGLIADIIAKLKPSQKGE